MSEKKLHMLSYEHGGYVLWWSEVEKQLTLKLGWLDKYPKFKFGLDYEAFTFDECDRIAPHINKIIAETLEKYPDRFALGSTTYGQPLSLYISEESNARQLIYAVRTNLSHFGTTPKVYAISEFALHNQIPQLAKQVGYEAGVLRSHVMGFGYPRTFDSAWGNWIGKDGTALPSLPTYPDEGEGYSNCTVDNWILTRWPDHADGIGPEDFEKKYAKYEPLIASRYDDLCNGREELTALVEKTDRYDFILLEDIPKICGEAKDELRTTDNDFHGRMPWGYCGNEIFNDCRATETRAALAERLNAFSVMLGGKCEQEALEEAWKNALVLQHHDITICGLFNDSHRFAPASLKASDSVIASSAAYVAPKFARKDSEGVFAFNTNSFPVKEWIDTGRTYGSVYDGDKELPTAVQDGKLMAYAEIEPLTAKRLEFKSTPASKVVNFCYDAQKGILSTPEYNIKLTSKGIAYIDCARSGRRLVDNGEGALLEGWVVDGMEYSDAVWTVTFEGGSVKAVQNGTVGCIPFTFEMRLTAGSWRIDCRADFDMNNEKVGHAGRLVDEMFESHTIDGQLHEEKLGFVMNLCLENDRRMYRDLPYSISEWDGQLWKSGPFWHPDMLILTDRTVTPEESFAGTTYLNGIYWFALRDKDWGMSVFNRGCMGSAVQGNKVTVPLIYADEYLCGKKMLKGHFGGEFALYPFLADTTLTDIHRAATAYNYPVITAPIAKGEGELDCVKVGSLEGSKDVIMTTLYAENGMILARMCNFSDESASVKLDSFAGKAVAETDLLGNDTKALTSDVLEFHPWEIKTVRLAK